MQKQPPFGETNRKQSAMSARLLDEKAQFCP
jgi:hypothetical protein